MEKFLGKNWRTTLLGILGIVGLVAHVGQSLLQGQPIDWASTVTQLMLAFGLIRAADATKPPAPPNA